MSAAASKRIRRFAEDWRLIFEQHHTSGLSQAAFCKREGIALSTFARWKQRLSDEAPLERTGGSAANSDWIDLSRTENASAGWTIELDLGDGICLRLVRG